MLQYIRGSNAYYKDVFERKRKAAAEETERAAQKKLTKKGIDTDAVEYHKIECEIAELEENSTGMRS